MSHEIHSCKTHSGTSHFFFKRWLENRCRLYVLKMLILNWEAEWKPGHKCNQKQPENLTMDKKNYPVIIIKILFSFRVKYFLQKKKKHFSTSVSQSRLQLLSLCAVNPQESFYRAKSWKNQWLRRKQSYAGSTSFREESHRRGTVRRRKLPCLGYMDVSSGRCSPWCINSFLHPTSTHLPHSILLHLF